ncbi:c-type cytochrome [Roseivirga misakiensis]|uniref:Cytochrome C n=1 Tax=Roseivirga misakiensis TaxID=1563681 RepID=A0A1E5SXY7_9BACT|nr:c-type cytochrome [Roseivirga misakiensis]OEK03989.1 cytochrome C [Roseivirga misakiensis]
MDFPKVIRLVAQAVYAVFGLAILVLMLLIVLWVNPALISSNRVSPEDWRPRDAKTDLGTSPRDNLVKYGYEIITETSKHIGPMAPKVNVRYAGNNLSCQSCHLEAGRKTGSASFVGVANRFPQFRGRENKMGNLIERVNGCMERSMNGKVLPDNSLEMQAIIAYMEWLSENVPKDKEAQYKGFAKLEIPNKKADVNTGKALYIKHCQTCHMDNGQGQRPSENDKYLYPPLWGKDSYNHGAGMHRVITAAQFIKGNMPYLEATLDNPVLTDEEAYHVAAYINSFQRPQKANPEVDFPDKKLKPVSTPYGPWVDEFSPDQHKYGPFQPIMAWYEKELGIKKSK